MSAVRGAPGRRRRSRRTLGLLGLLAAPVMILGACGSGEGEGEGEGTGTTVTTRPVPAASEPAATTTVVPVDTTVPGASSTLAPVTAVPTTAPTTTLAPDLGAVEVELTDLGSYDQPIALAGRPGTSEMYLAERPGTIRLLTGEDDSVVLDISDDTEADGEQGLLGIAVAPDGGALFVSSTRNDGTSAIDRYQIAADGSVDAASRTVVIEIDQPYSNHNGGGIVFGPDGYLYAGYGDGGSGGDPERRALDTSTLLGKLLRLDVTGTPADGEAYAVPADNPFVGGGAARPEIWSIGLRNPWRFSFDSLTGDLWIGDVGQGDWEEVDVAPASAGAGRGVSFGWSAFEGTHRFNDDQSADGHVPPVYEYSHEVGTSVTGGYVYRGSAIPELYGAYVFADYEKGTVWAMTVDTEGRLADGPVELAHQSGLASFGQDADGELYVLSLDGPLSRIDPA